MRKEEEFDAKLNEIVKKDRWIIDFPQNELPEIYKMINRYKDGKDIVIFKSREETERYLQKMSLLDNSSFQRFSSVC